MTPAPIIIVGIRRLINEAIESKLFAGGNTCAISSIKRVNIISHCMRDIHFCQEMSIFFFNRL